MPVVHHEDPLPAFRFRVDITGIKPSWVPRLSPLAEVSGLALARASAPEKPGEKVPGPSSCPGVILKRGVTKDSGFWEWFCHAQADPSLRFDVRIILMDRDGKDAVAWTLVNAYPVRWTGPELKADTSAVAFETLELRCDRITWDSIN